MELDKILLTNEEMDAIARQIRAQIGDEYTPCIMRDERGARSFEVRLEKEQSNG